MSNDPSPRRSPQMIIVILAIVLVLVTISSFGIGRYDIAFARVVRTILWSPIFPPDVPVTPTEANVVFTVRMPRILLALLSGATLQGVFRNPLVGRQVMGVSSGAAFGGTLRDSPEFSALRPARFRLCLRPFPHSHSRPCAERHRCQAQHLGAGAGRRGRHRFLQRAHQPCAISRKHRRQAAAMVFWLLGSFATANWEKLFLIAGPVLVGGILLLGLRWRINLLSIGDQDARALGVNVEPLRWLILVLVSCIVAAQVAVCGIISWVGPRRAAYGSHDGRT